MHRKAEVDDSYRQKSMFHVLTRRGHAGLEGQNYIVQEHTPKYSIFKTIWAKNRFGNLISYMG
jgi:hypothetical protein